MFNLNLNKEKDDFANQMLDNYPDFDNILIKWNGQTVGVWTHNVEDLETEFTVWWTSINNIWETLNRYTLLNGSIWTSGNVWSNNWLICYANGINSYENISVTYRVWLLWELPAWKIVWKKVTVFTICMGGNLNWYGGNNITYVIFKNIKYKIRVLHSDWTFTDVWDVVYIENWTKEVSFGQNVGGYWFQYLIDYWYSTKNFNWVTTVTWDRIVCDIFLDVSLKDRDNAGKQICAWILPWYAWSLESISSKNWPKPIQISIE